MHGAMRKLQYIPITCLREPRFLVAWNMLVSCNLPCATHEITTHGVATHVTATQGVCLGKYLTMHYCKNTMKQFFA